LIFSLTQGFVRNYEKYEIFKRDPDSYYSSPAKKANLGNIVKTPQLSVDLFLTHGFNVNDLFTYLNNPFLVFRYRNFKV